MRVAYTEGLIRHLLATSGHRGISTVHTYAEARAVGPGWSPHGIKVDTSTGTAVYYSLVRTSPPVDAEGDEPEVFDPADLTRPDAA